MLVNFNKKMKKYFSIFFVLFLIFGSFFSVTGIFAAMTSGEGYQIWADAISMGGDLSDSPSNYSLDDVIGEMIIGRSSDDMQLQPGLNEIEIGVISLDISPTTIDFGQLSKTATKSSNISLIFYSNLAQGKVYFTGTTLTGGSNTIAAIGSVASNSNIGTSQFGFNAIYQSGDTNGQSLAPYNDPDKFAFSSGNEIINAVYAMGTSTNFNLQFIANIGNEVPAGEYNSNLVFTALGGF